MNKTEQYAIKAIELRKLRFQNGELKTKHRLKEIECEEVKQQRDIFKKSVELLSENSSDGIKDLKLKLKIAKILTTILFALLIISLFFA